MPIDVGEWNARRLSVIMVVRAKFEQNPALTVAPGNYQIIVEDNNWGDTLLGVKCRALAPTIGARFCRGEKWRSTAL